MARGVRGDWWGQHEPLNLSYLESNLPCRAACPVGTNAGGYVGLIAQGRFAEAYILARRPNPFASVCGRICAHPCEAACRRGAIDAPLDIRALKRVVTEKFGVETNIPFEEIRRHLVPPRPRASTPGRIGVVGAGPAGLSCAHDLALMGHTVVVYDAAKIAGGMMRFGIPEYRLPRELLQCEIDFIQHLGVEIRLGVEIGKDLTFAALRSEHDALFVAPGCRKGRTVNIPGADSPSVLTAIDFLAAMNIGTPLEVGKRVVVVGGGNVAFDAARSARRFGGTSQPDEEHHNLMFDTVAIAARVMGREVTMLTLESEEELPADPRELEEAREEGITVVHRRGAKAVLSEGGRIRALQTIDVARVFDENRRFNPEYLPNTEKELACDTVIFAVGQIADLSFLGSDHGLEITPRNTIQVDRATCATNVKGVYAGGDVAFGPRIVIEAVADGRRAARSIDTLLTGRTDPPNGYVLRVFHTHGYDHPFARGDYEQIPRTRLPTVAVERRTLSVEVERVLDDEGARHEAQRCLHCWVNTIFDSSAINGSECIQCGGCIDVCPEQCIDLVSLRKLAAAPDPAAAPEWRLPDGASFDTLRGPADALLLKDETACIRCGLCARRCPAQVISMQALYRVDERELVSLADTSI